MKTTIKVTHIDTASHGYLSVSKSDFIKIGGDPNKITHYSGHNYSRVYLEEDCDAAYFMDVAGQNGFQVEVKSGYNQGFKISHNYNPDAFHYINPKVGDKLLLTNGETAVVESVDKNKSLIVSVGYKKYRIPGSNPFQYINLVEDYGN